MKKQQTYSTHALNINTGTWRLALSVSASWREASFACNTACNTSNMRAHKALIQLHTICIYTCIAVLPEIILISCAHLYKHGRVCVCVCVCVCVLGCLQRGHFLMQGRLVILQRILQLLDLGRLSVARLLRLRICPLVCARVCVFMWCACWRMRKGKGVDC